MLEKQKTTLSGLASDRYLFFKNSNTLPLHTSLFFILVLIHLRCHKEAKLVWTVFPLCCIILHFCSIMIPYLLTSFLRKLFVAIELQTFYLLIVLFKLFFHNSIPDSCYTFFLFRHRNLEILTPVSTSRQPSTNCTSPCICLIIDWTKNFIIFPF